MIDQISPSQFKAWLQQHAAERAVVLDVREPWEVQTACIRVDGFELLTIPMGEIAQRVAELDAERPVACLCHHGARSQRVALFLQAQGHTTVMNLAGGIDAWSRELDPSIPRY